MAFSINILHGSLSNINSLALAFPFLAYLRELRSAGITVQTYTDLNRASRSESDILVLDSKYFRDSWRTREDEILRALEKLRECAGHLLWFNTSDGTGTIQDQVMGIVQRYYKGQLLVDRNFYRQGLYGDRLFSDYYHSQFGIQDSDVRQARGLCDAQVKKLRLSWNLGLAPGFTYFGNLYSSIVIRSGIQCLTRYPIAQRKGGGVTKKVRAGEVAGRFSTKYSRETVAFQRGQIESTLSARRVATGRVAPFDYYEELKTHMVSVSPFGWGEVCIRDFETILAGAVLLKPDMSHLETFPSLYKPFETYIPIAWDLHDLDEKIDFVLANHRESREIAAHASREYGRYFGREGAVTFIKKVSTIGSDIGLSAG